MSFVDKFLSASILEKSATQFLDHGNIDHLFVGEELDRFKWMRGYATKYGAMPTENGYEQHTGQVLYPVEEPAAYYLNVLKSMYVEKQFQRFSADVKKIMNASVTDELRGQKLYELSSKFVSEVTSKHLAHQITSNKDFRSQFMRTYKKKHYKDNELSVRMGWPTLDKATGGLDRGDVVSICGRPGQGKTQLMLFSALFGWYNFGQNSKDHGRLFVSMEMDRRLLIDRMAGIIGSLPSAKIKNAALTSLQLEAITDKLEAFKTWLSDLIVIDANLSGSVDTIRTYALQYKPASIFIDGAYLLKHPTERDRFRRVAENADLIKKELAPIAPVVCSWQFSRDAAKKKKTGDKVDLEDIGYSDAIGQISSVVLGLFEDDTDKKLAPLPGQEVEVSPYKRVEILKGRSGERGSFYINWDWETSNFSEYVKEDVADLQIS